jgi:hypothetical protein
MEAVVDRCLGRVILLGSVLFLAGRFDGWTQPARHSEAPGFGDSPGSTDVVPPSGGIGLPVPGPPVFDPAREDWASFAEPVSRRTDRGREDRSVLSAPWAARPGLPASIHGFVLAGGQDLATNPILSLLPHGRIVGRPFGATGVGDLESPVLEFRRWTEQATRGLWAPEFSGESNPQPANSASPGFQPLVEASPLAGQAPENPDSFSGNLLFLLGGVASGVVAASVIWFVPKGRAPGA